jgi:hypothetical protein
MFHHHHPGITVVIAVIFIATFHESISHLHTIHPGVWITKLDQVFFVSQSLGRASFAETEMHLETTLRPEVVSFAVLACN